MARGKGCQQLDRIQINVSNETRATLERIKERTDAASISEAIRRAVMLYDMLLQEGRSVVVKANGVERDLMLF